ncbi:MAG: nodulation protein NodZ [bacterium]
MGHFLQPRIYWLRQPPTRGGDYKIYGYSVLRAYSPLRVKSRFVISARIAGLGDCLLSLMSAWRYAKLINRTLVIDWRQSLYLRDKNQNAFSAFFEPISAIDGVPVICDDTISLLKFPAPVYLALEQRGKLNPFIVRHSYNRLLRKIPPMIALRNSLLHQAQRNEVELITSARDVPEPTVKLQGCLPAELSNPEACQTFLDHLKPRQDIQREIDAFANAHFRGRKVIAVHVRHSNGANIIDNHTPYWMNESRAISKICQAIERVRAVLGKDAIVFLCTDSRKVLTMIECSLANVITRKKYFRPENHGELHAYNSIFNNDGAQIGKEAVVEMFLLSQGDGLVCYPPDSYFSFYARTCRSRPSVRQVDELRLEPES